MIINRDDYEKHSSVWGNEMISLSEEDIKALKEDPSKMLYFEVNGGEYGFFIDYEEVDHD